MKLRRKLMRSFSAFINKLAGGTAQNENTGEVRGEAFHGMAEAARKAASDGSVLLVNDGVLPLGKENKVALFGRVQHDWFYVGYGSGGDVRAPYLVSPVDGLKSAGVRLDETLLSLYAERIAEDPADHGFWGHWPWSHPEIPLSDEEILSAAKRNDVAVVFIGRGAGEDRDASLKKGSFYLTDEELSLLARVRKAFSELVVVLNIGSPIDMEWCKDISPSALLIVWQGGMESGNALADILTGASEPGGRLTDSIATNYQSYPSSSDFGNSKFNFYTEDIYVGYRWFSTFAPENVLFPFGAGEGYTTFSIQPLGVDFDGKNVSVKAGVANTGKRGGREVLQLYVALPNARLSHPARELAAFCKTEEVLPGESAEYTLSFNLDDIRSFDDRTSEWVTEKGAYSLFLGKNVRDALPAGGFEVSEERTQKVPSASAPVIPFERVVNKNGKPQREPVPLSRTDLKARILSELPEKTPAPASRVSFADVKAGRSTPEQLAACLSDEDLEAISRGDYTMDSPLGAKGNAGVLGGVTPSLAAFGIPTATTTDGPSGIRLAECCTLLPSGICLASSWDVKAVEKLTSLLGQEMKAKGSDILLAPGMNIHRDPLCGRNFEYFSEDPLLTGRIAAAYIRGVGSAGVSACPKHFACNNQEKLRIYNDSRLSERALREIYLKGFGIAVREGKPLNIMTSYNKINGVWGHYNYDLATTVLRKEWGFDGCVMTDWWMRYSASPEFPRVKSNAYRVRAQVDVLMPGGKRTGKHRPDGTLLATLGEKEGITRAECERTAANVIKMLARLDK